MIKVNASMEDVGMDLVILSFHDECCDINIFPYPYI